jgi:hypothetical protein
MVNLNFKVQRSPLEKTNKAVAWLQNYFDLIGDHLPQRMVIHLPSNLTKLFIFQRMVEDFKSREEVTHISQSGFFKLWEEHFSHVSIPKKNRFTKCDICSVIKSEKEKTFCQEKIKELFVLMADHLNLQMYWLLYM